MEIEISLFRSINRLSHQLPWLDFLMQTLSSPSFWMLVGLTIFVVSWRTKNGRLMGVLFTGILALAAVDLISFEIIKPLVARERPCWLLADVRLYDGRCGGSYGFTSNHAANAFAVWTVVARVYGLRSYPAQFVLVLATMVGLSRVYLGVHFVGDIAGGAILGILVSSSLWALGLGKLPDRIAALTEKNQIQAFSAT